MIKRLKELNQSENLESVWTYESLQNLAWLRLYHNKQARILSQKIIKVGIKLGHIQNIPADDCSVQKYTFDDQTIVAEVVETVSGGYGGWKYQFPIEELNHVD